MLAETHQQIVVLDPILFGKFRAQRDFGLLRCLGFDIAPAIRNPMHMGVDADAGLFDSPSVTTRLAVLRPTPLNFKQLVDFVGNFAAILIDQ